MKLKILVIATKKWTSRRKKHEIITKLLKTGGIIATFDTIKLDLGVPRVTNGRIDTEWYEKNITTHARKGDYNHIIFSFSEKEGKRWGLESGVRGHNIKDTDSIGESWICSDEKSIVKFKDGTERDKYTKTIAHEIGHELKNRGYTILDIHDFDFGNTINNLEGFYKKLKMV